MTKSDFSIIHDNGKVTFVRNQSVAQKKASVGSQSIRVQCFESAQVERVFHYQEREIQRVDQSKKSGIKKIFHW